MEKEIKIQGYEHIALNILIKKYQEDDIVTNKSLIPDFWYYDNNNIKRRYFPDIYILSKKLIIEVKSVWTNKMDKNEILLKEKSVTDLGYIFEKMVFDKKGNLINDNNIKK